MIDNIKFTFQYEGEPDWLDRVRDSTVLNPTYRNGVAKGYRARLYKDRNTTRKQQTGNRVGIPLPALDLDIIVEADNLYRITIRNSIRKWYSNDKIHFDFTKATFKDCIQLIADKLNVPDYLLYRASVTKVEYGTNVIMNERFRCFYACLHSHNTLTKKMTIGAETVSFIGESKHITFYDKYVEHKDKKKIKSSVQKQIHKKAIVIRYEIGIGKVSAVKFAKENMNSIGSIYENWDMIADSLYKELDNINFVNNLTPNIYKHLDNKRKIPFQEYLIYLGVEQLGLDNLNTLLLEQSHVNTRKSSGRDFEKIYNDFKELVEQDFFEDIFRAEMREKISEITA